MDLIEVCGYITDSSDRSMRNKNVRFIPSFDKVALFQGSNKIISDEVIYAVTDNQGWVSQKLYPTDDDRLIPLGFNYKVIEPTGREYFIQVPKNSPNGKVFLSSVVEQTEPSPGYVQIIGGVDQSYVDGAIENHIESLEPHPVYDDIPSLVLLYENGLV